MLGVSTERVDLAIAAIRASGSRVTVDRRAVVEALDRSGDHLTAEQLADAVWVHYPDINLATIYRTLELLERLEIAFHVHLGHGPSRWHLADDVHHHLVCEICNRWWRSPTPPSTHSGSGSSPTPGSSSTPTTSH